MHNISLSILFELFSIILLYLHLNKVPSPPILTELALLLKKKKSRGLAYVTLLFCILEDRLDLNIVKQTKKKRKKKKKNAVLVDLSFTSYFCPLVNPYLTTAGY